MTKPPSNDTLENARVEYGAAHDAYLHYDNFSWQVGSVLVAGAFVFWGFLLGKDDNLFALAGANLVVCLLMSAWVLYANHNREIYFWKLHRVRQLEELLGMWQHRRFVALTGQKPEYPLHWPSGHVLNYFIYGLVSLGGPALVTLAKPTCSWPWLSLLINSLVVILVVWRAEAASQGVARAIRDKESGNKQRNNVTEDGG